MNLKCRGSQLVNSEDLVSMVAGFGPDSSDAMVRSITKPNETYLGGKLLCVKPQEHESQRAHTGVLSGATF